MSGFSPLRRAPRAKRTAVVLLGPLLWVAALVVLAAVVRRGSAVGVALVVAGGSLALGVVCLAAMRLARERRERAGTP